MQRASYSPNFESLEGKVLLAAPSIPPISMVVTVRDQVTPIVLWNTPAPITYGAKIGAAQLNAYSTVPGKFSYAQTGLTLSAGTHTLWATFAPADPVTYAGVNISTQITVQKANPTVNNWAPPTNLYQGELYPVSAKNATAIGVDNAPLAGTFIYNPQPGLKMTYVGTSTITVSFIPTDTANYNTAESVCILNVRPLPPPQVVTQVVQPVNQFDIHQVAQRLKGYLTRSRTPTKNVVHKVVYKPVVHVAPKHAVRHHIAPRSTNYPKTA
jgi:hypothetical protein